MKKSNILIPLTALALALPTHSKAQEIVGGTLNPDNIVEHTIKNYERLSPFIPMDGDANTVYGQLGLCLDCLSQLYPDSVRDHERLENEFRRRFENQITTTLNLREHRDQLELRIKQLLADQTKKQQLITDLNTRLKRLFSQYRTEQLRNAFLKHELENASSTSFGIEPYTNGLELNVQRGDLIFGLGVYHPDKDEQTTTTTQTARTDLANGHYTITELINTTTARNHDYAVAARLAKEFGTWSVSIYPSIRERATTEQQETILSHYVSTDHGDMRLSTRSERSAPHTETDRIFGVGIGVGVRIGNGTWVEASSLPGGNVSAGLRLKFGG